MKRLIIICFALAGMLTVACQKGPAPVEDPVDEELLALQARTPRPLLELNGTIWTLSSPESVENMDERGILIPAESGPVVNARSAFDPQLFYAFENGRVTVLGKFSIPYGTDKSQKNTFWLKTPLGHDGVAGKYSMDEGTMTFSSNALYCHAKGNDYKVYILNSGEFFLLGKSPWEGHDFVLFALRPANSEEQASLAKAVSADDPNYDAYIQQMFDTADKYAKGDSMLADSLHYMIQQELDLFFK